MSGGAITRTRCSGSVEEVREHGAHGVGRLGRVPHGEAVQRLVVTRHHAAALHRVAAAAHDPEGLAQRVIGGGEGALRVPDPLDDVGRDVVAQLLVDQRGAGGQRRSGGARRRAASRTRPRPGRTRPRRARATRPRPRPRPRPRGGPCPSAGCGARRGEGRCPAPGSACGRATASGCRRPRPAVTTASTPGRARAAAASSRRRMRAWACGLRTMAACATPGISRSSTNVPRPREQAGVLAARHGRADVAAPRRAHRGRRRHRVGGAACARGHEGQHGVDHALVAGAAAQMPGERLADLASVGSGSSRSAAVSDMRMPPVQKPHWTPWWRTNSACNGLSALGIRSQALDRLDGLPSACTASIKHPRTASPSTSTVHAPQTPCSHPTCVPVRRSCSRRRSTSVVRLVTVACRGPR